MSIQSRFGRAGAAFSGYPGVVSRFLIVLGVGAVAGKVDWLTGRNAPLYGALILLLGLEMFAGQIKRDVLLAIRGDSLTNTSD